MDCENQEKDKDGNPLTTGSFNNNNTNNSECYAQFIAWPEIYACIGFSLSHLLVCCCACRQIFKTVMVVNNSELFFRYSDNRLHTGPVPANRSLCVSACHVLLLWLGTSGLHYLHCRWLLLFSIMQNTVAVDLKHNVVHYNGFQLLHTGGWLHYWICKDGCHMTENYLNKQFRVFRPLVSLFSHSFHQFLQQLHLHSSCCQCASIWPDPVPHRTSKDILLIPCMSTWCLLLTRLLHAGLL